MALRGGLCLVFLVGLIWVQIAVAKKTGCIAPKLLYLPKNRAQVAIGRDIKLFCQISRVSRGTSYKWFKDGQRLYRKNNDRIRVKRMRFLKIKKTSLKDNGKYMCMAKNPCGLVKATIKLFVKTPPTVSTTPSIPVPPKMISKRRSILVAVPVGNTVKLDCSATGYPQPLVKWTKNGKPFAHRSGGPMYLSAYDYIVGLKGVVLSDSGIYVCNVSNAYGWFDRTFRVDVRERVRAKRPVLQPIANVTVLEGQNASILCTAISDYMPHFQFIRFFTPIINSTSNQTIQRFEVIKQTPTDDHVIERVKKVEALKTTISGVKLTLFNVTKGNDGRYMCMAGNSIGFNVQDMYLKVIAKEERDRTKPSIPKIENVTAREGENASIVCKASSYSMPHFQFLRWFKPSSSADIPRLEVIKQTPGKVEILTLKYNSTLNGVKLTLFNVRKGNEGRYMCMAGNYIGYNVQHMYLKVIAKEAA